MSVECVPERKRRLLCDPGGEAVVGDPGGRNFKSCLQISLRVRKAPGEHLRAESSPALFPLLPLFLSDGWTYLFQREDIYFRTTSGINQSADLCEPYAGVTDICEVEEEECIVSL